MEENRDAPGGGPADQAAETSAVQMVEAALLRRALGMTVVETRTELTDKGEKTVSSEKEMPPDLTAITFWLKNRCPGRWGERPNAPETEPDNNLLEILQQAAGDA